MIHFIVPPEERVINKSSKIHRVFPPLSLLNCARILKDKGYEVSLEDFTSNAGLKLEDFIDKYNQAEALIISTSTYADWQCPTDNFESTIWLTSQIKNPNLIIIGNHGTHFPSDVLKRTQAKSVIRGEPEPVIAQLVNEILTNKSIQTEAVSYIDQNSAIQHNPERPKTQLSQAIQPLYDLINLKDYTYELMGPYFAILEGARGCPYSCNFCNLSMFNTKYQKQEIPLLLEQLTELVEVHGCKNLYFLDLEFTINKKLTRAVCEYLIEKKYKEKFDFQWACQTRADSIDDDLMLLMKRSGCDLIHFGVEAGNPQILESTNKRTTKEKIIKGFELAKKHQIRIAGFFILGHKNETPENLNETIQFAKKLNPNYATFHKLIAFPGSPLFTEQYGEGPYWDKSLEELAGYEKFEGDQYLPSKTVNRFLLKAYLSFYLRVSYFLKSFRLKDIKLAIPFFKILTGFR